MTRNERTEKRFEGIRTLSEDALRRVVGGTDMPDMPLLPPVDGESELEASADPYPSKG